ncbi:MAG: class III extradiol dioxygenase subunit B-like domain-containing protein [Jiangellaceae bacterium]|nr:class III extradiol dioxygenase subunit B-like domain-containing protein [Jiangellaceae bacterium]
MLVAAAVCPHPPLLVPGLAGARAGELDGLRTACLRAIDAMRATEPDLLVLVGAGEMTRRHPPGTAGSLAAYGVDVPVVLPGEAPGRSGGELPLSLLVGAWLLGQARWSAQVRGQEVARSTDPDECRRIGIQLARKTDRLAMLVMGDGSACRSADAPASFDSRAEAFDMAVVDALRAGDPAALLAIDPETATQLVVAGRAPWQVLAGAAEDAVFDADVLYAGAPFGVGYFVAVWERHG